MPKSFYIEPAGFSKVLKSGPPSTLLKDIGLEFDCSLCDELIEPQSLAFKSKEHPNFVLHIDCMRELMKCFRHFNGWIP